VNRATLPALAALADPLPVLMLAAFLRLAGP
jgi:hypothetical protein